MLDRHGRNIRYLRVSVTENCGLRCVYCAGPSERDRMKREELSAGEIVSVARAFAELGGDKIRFTGGEPLTRRDLEDIIAGVKAIGAYKDLAMTTNAHGLAERLPGLVKAGLGRVNISVDSLIPERYGEMTGGDLNEALCGARAVMELGIPLKLNMVLTPLNADEADSFINLAKDWPAEVRFIELMPFGPYGEERMKARSNADIIKERPYLKPDREPGRTADVCRPVGFKGAVGFISAVSERFCATCDRVRLTADGSLMACLGDGTESQLRGALAQGGAALEASLREAIYEKAEGHRFGTGFTAARPMNAIGG